MEDNIKRSAIKELNFKDVSLKIQSVNASHKSQPLSLLRPHSFTSLAVKKGVGYRLQPSQEGREIEEKRAEEDKKNKTVLLPKHV